MIRLQNVSKQFGKRLALSNIQLDIADGERLALVGHNGSGKTTLIRCILGLYHCSGKIDFDGRDPRYDRERVLQALAFVPQVAPALNMSVEAFLEFVESVSGVGQKIVAQNANELGLDIRDNLAKNFRSLSGGMKQKLLIAAALARKPRVLIMDEPAANLDPIARATFFELLKELPASTAMILSSHRVDELSGIVTRLVELDNGKIVINEQIVARNRDSNLGKTVTCQVSFSQLPETAARFLEEWKFESDTTRLVWHGSFAAPDKFRFISAMTKWSAFISQLALEGDAQFAGTKHSSRFGGKDADLA